MARRAVVVEPGPDKPRQPVVLREGPPVRDRRRITDIIVGVLGVLVLVAAVLLVNLLPQDEPLPDQYEVRYTANIDEDPTVQTLDIQEGGSGSAQFPFDGRFLYRIEVQVEWLDDVVESDPDSFEIRLIDPSGAVVRGPVNATNPHPATDGSPAAPTYVGRPASRLVSFDLAPRPSTEIVVAQDGEDAVAVQARVEARAATNGTGTWVLEATLVDAGDCPDPSGLDLNRALSCFATTGGGEDTGNPFQVVRVAFISYTPAVSLLE